PSTRALGGELGAHEVDPVLAPKQLPVDHESRHGEYPLLLGFSLLRLQRCPALAGGKGIESLFRHADVLQEGDDGAAILVVELAFEETGIGRVDKRAATPFALGEKPGEVNPRRIEDLLRPVDDHAALIGEAADVGIEISYAPHAALGGFGIVDVVG